MIVLNQSLCSNRDRSGPLPYHESSGKILPPGNSQLQGEIAKLKQISDEREMVLNAKKTCIFIANFTHDHQFKPWLSIPGQNQPIEVVLETKLLGYWLTSDMKPAKHVDYTVKKANKRIWVIRRLKAAGASDQDLVTIYLLLIRSILETNCPVFHPQLTQENKADLERVQRSVVRIILSDRHEGWWDDPGYERGCQTLGLDNLDERRENLCLQFGLNCLRSERHKNLFPRLEPNQHFMREVIPFAEPLTRTERYRRSPIPYIARLLNNHYGTAPP